MYNYCKVTEMSSIHDGIQLITSNTWFERYNPCNECLNLKIKNIFSILKILSFRKKHETALHIWLYEIVARQNFHYCHSPNKS